MPETRHCAISCGAYSTDGKKCGVKAVSGAFKSFYPKSSTSTPSTHREADELHLRRRDFCIAAILAVIIVTLL